MPLLYSLLWLLLMLSGGALAQTATPGSFTPSASGTQLMLQSGTVAQNHVPLATSTAGQYADGGPLPTATLAPNPVQLTASVTLTAAQLVLGSTFWYNGSTAITATLPTPALGLRGFFENDSAAVLTIASASGPFLNQPGSLSTVLLSQPYLSSTYIWADGTSWHVGQMY